MEAAIETSATAVMAMVDVRMARNLLEKELSVARMLSAPSIPPKTRPQRKGLNLLLRCFEAGEGIRTLDIHLGKVTLYH